MVVNFCLRSAEYVGLVVELDGAQGADTCTVCTHNVKTLQHDPNTCTDDCLRLKNEFNLKLGTNSNQNTTTKIP